MASGGKQDSRSENAWARDSNHRVWYLIAMAKSQPGRVLDEEHKSLLLEIAEIVLDPEAWLTTPNGQLGGQSPRDLLDSAMGREILHNLVQTVKSGMVS
jgi:hypothetical protein